MGRGGDDGGGVDNGLGVDNGSDSSGIASSFSAADVTTLVLLSETITTSLPSGRVGLITVVVPTT